MQKGDKIETHPHTWVQIKSISEDGTTATVYQLDSNKRKIKLFRKEGYLEGILTIKETETLSL